MKKLLINLFAAVALIVNVSAATTAIANQAATNAVIVNAPLVLDSITLYSTNTTPTIVYLFDGAITNVTAAWTNYTTYTTNQTYSYINSLGTTNLQTNTTLYVQANAHAAATNNSTPLASFVVPASGGLVTFTPPIPLTFASKLTLSNNLIGVSGVVSYRSP
jgi:hypothetical protein